MAKPATRITLNPEEEQTLRGWLRNHKTERRIVERARIVLLAASGASTTAIAHELGTPPARVSKWRLRFAEQRLLGLADRPRRGKPQYSSLNDSDAFLDIRDVGPDRLVSPQRKAAHLSLDAARIAASSPQDHALLENLVQHRFMKGFSVPRGE